MKYFFDTEFIENGREHFPELLSIGIVAEDGREFYAERLNAPWHLASEWVIENVRPHLWHLAADKGDFNRWSRDGGTGGLMDLPTMAAEIRRFVGPDRPEFWAYYADYDWVILCGLFGRMIDLPDGWPMYCRDIKQKADDLGNPRLPKQSATEHHALEDARWNAQAFRFLRIKE